MDAILDVAARHRRGGRRGQRPRAVRQVPRPAARARFGGLATLSFHETKNFTCGEGGALVSTTRRWSSAPRSSARRARTAAASSAARWTSTPGWTSGSSYLPSDLLAALLCAQLEARARSRPPRRQIWERYRGRAGRLGGRRTASGCPPSRPHCEQPYHLFYLLLPSLEDRAGAHRPPEGSAGMHGVVPLPAAAPVGDGPALRRAAGRLPGDRERERPPGAPAPLPRTSAIPNSSARHRPRDGLPRPHDGPFGPRVPRQGRLIRGLVAASPGVPLTAPIRLVTPSPPASTARTPVPYRSPPRATLARR